MHVKLVPKVKSNKLFKFLLVHMRANSNIPLRLEIAPVLSVSKYGVISGPYFPVFGLSTEIYEVNLRIQFEYRKIRTKNNSVSGHFSSSVRMAKNKQKCLIFIIVA